VIGLSYYPKWHGTINELEYNFNDLTRRYNKEVIVAEYSAMKEAVNKIAFESARGKGTCIWNHSAPGKLFLTNRENQMTT
jgi:beta-galactosidase